jgi:hypothetical protein
MKPTKLAFTKIESAESGYVLVLGPINPPDGEWSQWVDYIANNIVPGSGPRVLVVTEGGSPTAGQRAALSNVTDQHRNAAKVAVCTDSTMARGAITALSWFLPNAYRAFSPADIDRAIDYLDLRSSTSEIKATIKILQRQLGLSLTIR